MRSPTAALVWEMWRQHRWTLAAIAGLTAAGHLLAALENANRAGGAADDSSPVITILAMIAFLLLLGVLNYTETSAGRSVGQFPRRLFVLPVTSLRLVAVPLLVGIASVEFLFLLWMSPLSGRGSASLPFIALLLAALVVFYLWALWTLERAGSMRLFVLGLIVIALFTIEVLPSFAPSPPPWWRSEGGLAALVTGLTLGTFLHAWRHVAQLRAGGPRRNRASVVVDWIADLTPTRRRPFATPAAAHFWYEWRASGTVLPALVAGVVVVILPMSLLARGDADDTFQLLLATLAVPIVLAVPVGVAFSKPTFWSENLAVPAFVAVRPLSSEDLVAIKVRVAAMSAALAWLVVLLFLTVWLFGWANVDALSQLAIQVWAFHGRSLPAVFAIGGLVVLAGLFLTWRFLLCRLWSGLLGKRWVLVAAVVSIILIVVASLVFDATRVPGWLLDDPARLMPVAWIAAGAVVAKYWMAAYAWRGVSARYVRTYLAIWCAGTMLFLTLGLAVWGIVRIYVALDTERVRSLVVLLALLAMPLARVGFAPSTLMRNRHR